MHKPPGFIKLNQTHPSFNLEEGALPSAGAFPVLTDLEAGAQAFHCFTSRTFFGFVS